MESLTDHLNEVKSEYVENNYIGVNYKVALESKLSEIKEVTFQKRNELSIKK